jgi:hypothetical protein
MLYDIPINYDNTGKLQHSLVCKDIVLCLCYQPPSVSYKHPNSGRGVSSQAVYVVSGDYVMVPNYALVPHITPESHPPLHIKEGEIVDLEKYMNICTIDTAGENGVMMIHINPLSGEAEYNCSVITNNEKTIVSTDDKRTIAFTLKEKVYINDLELSLLNRVRLKKNSEITIETSEDGVCLILEKRTENEKLDQLNSELIRLEESKSKWSQYHKYKMYMDKHGPLRKRLDFTDN